MKIKNNLFLQDTNMEIYEKIRVIRQSKGFTQEYVANKLNIDTVNYGRIERGQAKLTVDRLMKISEIIDFNVKDLFYDENRKDDLTNKLLLRIYYLNKLIYREFKNK